MTEISKFSLGFMMTNCYLIKDIDTQKVAIVDPGFPSKELMKKLNTEQNNIEMILLTHGHFDHIGYANELREKFGAKIYIGINDSDYLQDSNKNLSVNLVSSPMKPFEADVLLNDNDTFSLGKTEIKFMETPGHTKGGGCYIFDDVIISGDTLFCESAGRTDFIDGNAFEIQKSLQKLSSLEGDYRVYPGHDISTTLEHERKYNPYMKNGFYEDLY